MVTFTLQLLDLIANGVWHPFFVYFIFVWVVWLLRLFFASRCRKYETTWDGSISVVVPTRGESVEETRKCVQSLLSQTRPAEEIIFVIDKGDVQTGLPAVFEEFNVRFLIDEAGNKRDAFALGARATRDSDILIMCGGDAIYPPHFMVEALRPFADPKVGGVCLTQYVKNPEQSIAHRIAAWMHDYRFKVSYPMMGWKGVVVCLTGETYVARREIVMRHLDAFLNETFLGRRCIPGDDRFLTHVILRDGYKCVYQPLDPPVLVDAPSSFRGFVRQQLRWLRTSQRYTLETLTWCWGKSPMLPFHLASVYVTLYSFVAVTIWGVLNTLFNMDPNRFVEGTHIFDFPWMIGWAILGLYISQVIRQVVHLTDHPEDWKLFWLYVLTMVFVFVPLTVYALFTMYKTGWLVRGNVST